MTSIFDMVPIGLPIEVFELTKCYINDKNPLKVNLGVGAYRKDDGKPWVLPVVRKTEIKISSDESILHEYLPALGIPEFCDAATKLLLGDKCAAWEQKRAFGIQAISGTGALYLGARFLSKIMKRETFYCSDPTWENHHRLFISAGFKNSRTYRYWDRDKRQFDFANACVDLEKAPAGAVIVLQAVCHNPTGCDPNMAQWKQLGELCLRRNLFVFFDCPYQGMATGDTERDGWPVRHFVDIGLELFVAQSFAKMFGLYSERVGNLVVVQRSPATTAAVKSQFSVIVRETYSNPPAFGPRIVAAILTDPELRKEWIDSLQKMYKRMKTIRQVLCDHLSKLGTPGTWNHIIDQIGMFSYTGLTEEQVSMLLKDYHIYILHTGRINIYGINDSNVEYVAKSINETIRRTSAPEVTIS